METVMNRRTAAGLEKHFAALSTHVPLRPIRSKRDHAGAVAALNALLDAGAAQESHPLAGLAATLGELVGNYDDANHPAKRVAPRDMLRFLLKQHGLRHGDVPEVGSQGVVSEVLSGKRALNLRQMRALAQRFSVPVGAFITIGPRRRPERLSDGRLPMVAQTPYDLIVERMRSLGFDRCYFFDSGSRPTGGRSGHILFERPEVWDHPSLTLNASRR